MSGLITRLKRQVNAVLRSRGYIINSTQPVDLRKFSNDPRLLHYYNGRELLILASTERGRIDFFLLTKKMNPFVQAVAEAAVSNDRRNVLEEILEAYFSRVIPKCLREWYGLDPEDAPGLRGVEPWVRPRPWGRCVSLNEIRKRAQNKTRVQNRDEGRNIGISDGYSLFGPVSREKHAVEVARFQKLMGSIQRDGYRRTNMPGGDIEAEVLIRDDGEWRWLAGEGKHRAATLAGLGYSEIPVRLTNVVYRKDCSIWPNVISGLYSPKGALKLFDRFFDGEYSLVVEPWHSARKMGRGSISFRPEASPRQT